MALQLDQLAISSNAMVDCLSMNVTLLEVTSIFERILSAVISREEADRWGRSIVLESERSNRVAKLRP